MKKIAFSQSYHLPPHQPLIPIDLYPDFYFREDLRKSFARSNTISSANADSKEGGEEWKEKAKEKPVAAPAAAAPDEASSSNALMGMQHNWLATEESMRASSQSGMRLASTTRRSTSPWKSWVKSTRKCPAASMPTWRTLSVSWL